MLQFIFPQVNIPVEELSFFTGITKTVSVQKGDFLFHPYKICDKIGLVRMGLLRSYVTVDDKEYNIEFYAENQFVSAFSSFLTQQPSDWCIQALEESEVVLISFDLLNQLYQRHPCWIEFGRKLFEAQTVKKCRREKSLIRDDAVTRYALFRQDYQAIENRVPLFQVAAYLGIEPETLSRVRRKYFLDLHQGS